jgi:HEAT repeat protein
MLRHARTMIPMLRALLVGSAAVTAVAASSVAVLSCADENDPETWVKKLGDPITKPGAVKRLIQFYEDRMTRANKDRSNPEVKGLVDKIIGPLTDAYVKGQLDEKTRIELIKLLADMRDARAKAAWIKGLSGFAQNAGASEDDVRWIAPAVGALKLEDCAEAMGQAFVKLEAGTQKGSQAYKNLHDSMLQLLSPSWKALMMERLNRPMSRPADKSTPEKVDAYRTELFWQTTAAEILAELKDPASVKSLFKVFLNPQKADVAGTASSAIIRMGKASVPFLLQALGGQDADVVEYAKANSGGNPEEAKSYVRWAAVMLGGIGRAEAGEPLIQALGGLDSDVNRAVVARELAKLPATPASIKAFQTAFEKVPPSTLMPLGDNARGQLMEEAAHFYDSALVPWMLKQIKEAKGEENDKNSLQISALTSAIKLMKKDQMADVKAAVEKEGTPVEKDAFKLAADVLNACGENVGCYLSKLQEPAAQEQKTQFIGLKSAYMLSILGNQGTAMEIAKQLQKVRNAAVRFTAVSAIDHLVQKDTGPVIDALQKIVDENKAKGDTNMMQSDTPVKQVIYRLRAR